MSLLSRFFASGDAPADRSPADDFWYEDIATTMAAAGKRVSEETVVQIPVAQASALVLAQTIAALPLKFFIRRSDGSKQRLDQLPAARLLGRQPNEYQTAYEFRQQMQWNLAFYRNAYAYIRSSGVERVSSLEPIHPLRVQLEELRGGHFRWRVVNDGGSVEYVHPDDMWHLKTAPFDDRGRVGIPVLSTSRQTFAAYIALQEYTSRFFVNDTQTGGVISHPGHFKNGDSRKNFLKAWRRQRSGANRHRDSLLEEGMTYNRSGQTNEESQFLETRKDLALDVARVWRMPPHKVGILDKATFSNIEQQSLEFVMDTLLPWLVGWEQCVQRDLILERFLSGTGDVDPENLFAEHDVMGLLRGDIKTRFEAYSRARQWGWLSVNDIRKLENMNPIDGGNEYLQPLNMVPAGSIDDAPAAGESESAESAVPHLRLASKTGD